MKNTKRDFWVNQKNTKKTISLARRCILHPLIDEVWRIRCSKKIRGFLPFSFLAYKRVWIAAPRVLAQSIRDTKNRRSAETSTPPFTYVLFGPTLVFVGQYHWGQNFFLKYLVTHILIPLYCTVHMDIAILILTNRIFWVLKKTLQNLNLFSLIRPFFLFKMLFQGR